MALALASWAGAQPPAAPARQLRALRVSEPIAVDGRLDEAAWSAAEALGGFRQQEPDNGRPATERTEVRVLYDERNLYIGIRAYDSEPAAVNARELRRDADFSNDDKVEVLLDTNHDRRNGFRFTVNPLGTQQDALITDEGRDINLSWDGRWLSAARVDGEGWTAELAVPLTTLRFKEGAPSWGLNVARRVRRKNEESLWTAWPKAYGLERVSQAGELTGLEGLKPRRVCEIKPYLAGGWRSGVPRVGGPGFNHGPYGAAGIEVARIGITPSLTAELTVNPDFGQFEADQQVVNLSRFPVFFPEKRDFFLENAGVFLFGDPGSNQPFFTRRVGLTADGGPVPIDYGAKLTGKAGPWDLGFLQAQSRQTGGQAAGGIPQQAFSVARVKRGFYERSFVGAIAANRQGGATPYNRAGGLDAQVSLSDHWQLRGYMMGTESPGKKDGVGSAQAGSRYEDDLRRLVVSYQEAGSRFDPQMGFAERTGIRDYFAQAAYKPQPARLHAVAQFEFEAQQEYIADRRGRLQTSQTELTWDTVFRDSSEVFLRPVEYVTDVLSDPFEIRPGVVIPPGRYHFNRPRVSISSDRSRRLVVGAREVAGPFYGGRRSETTGEATLRPDAHLRLSLSDTYNRVALPAGTFTTNLLALRASYNLSRSWMSDAFLQVNTAAQLTSVNARLRWNYRPGSDAFLIYNVSTGRGLERPSNQVQLKVTCHYGA